MASASSPAEPALLGVALGNNGFLSRVLEYLVEGGLQECRLVCRRWKSVCDQMSVKTAFSDTRYLSRALERFPKAAEVHSGRRRRHPRYCQQWEVTEALLRRLGEMPNLRSLILLGCLSTDSTHYALDCLSAFGRLEHLQFDLELTSPSAINAFFVTAVGYLTGLTSLAVEGGMCSAEFEDSAPFTGHTKLKDLSVPLSMMRTKDRMCPMFPRSPLTRLRFVKVARNDAENLAGHPQDVAMYGATLRDLDISDAIRTEDIGDQWGPLVEQLSLLESLTMELTSCRRYYFSVTVAETNEPTNERMTTAHVLPDEVSKYLSDSTSLQSLALSCSFLHRLRQPPLLPCSSLVGLTKLETNFPFCALEISSLTNLASLSVRSQQLRYLPELLNGLVRLSALRSLDLLSMKRDVFFSGSPVKSLTNLTHLSLGFVEIDADMLAAMACLSRITYLKLYGRLDAVFMIQLLEILGALSELTVLYLDVSARSEKASRTERSELPSFTRLCEDLPSGLFPRLQYFMPPLRGCRFPRISRDLDRIVLEKFPCFRRWANAWSDAE